MMLITKALAQAVTSSHSKRFNGWSMCDHCSSMARLPWDIKHKEDCIVPKAKLLLKLEWGIE